MIRGRDVGWASFIRGESESFVRFGRGRDPDRWIDLGKEAVPFEIEVHVGDLKAVGSDDGFAVQLLATHDVERRVSVDRREFDGVVERSCEQDSVGRSHDRVLARDDDVEAVEERSISRRDGFPGVAAHGDGVATGERDQVSHVAFIAPDELIRAASDDVVMEDGGDEDEVHWG